MLQTNLFYMECNYRTANITQLVARPCRPEAIKRQKDIPWSRKLIIPLTHRKLIYMAF